MKMEQSKRKENFIKKITNFKFEKIKIKNEIIRF